MGRGTKRFDFDVFLCTFGQCMMKKLHSSAKAGPTDFEYACVSAECCRHVGVAGNQCARSSTFGPGVTEEVAIERLKGWLLIGYALPARDKNTHMGQSF